MPFLADQFDTKWRTAPGTAIVHAELTPTSGESVSSHTFDTMGTLLREGALKENDKNVIVNPGLVQWAINASGTSCTVSTVRPPSRYDKHWFNQLASGWKTSRGMTSSPMEMAAHPAYQQIIRMGNVAIPLLLKELESRPDHWFIALKTITNADPVPVKSRGRLKEMSLAWIQWGRRNGFNT